MIILSSRKDAILRRYEGWLVARELAPNTVDKYVRDVGRLLDFAVRSATVPRLGKRLLVEYKTELVASYSPVSANSMIAAVNSFLTFAGRPELRIRQLRIQSRTYCGVKEELTKEEYLRLVEEADREGDAKFKLVVETLCSTGIRVSELGCMTVEAVRLGRADILLKGKARSVWIPEQLKTSILRFAQDEGVESGPVFRTRTGKALHRTYVWKRMKAVGEAAGVDVDKVYPHNLRHLFARTFYSAYKDMNALADVLGHSSLATTRIYVMSSGCEHRRQISELGLAA